MGEQPVELVAPDPEAWIARYRRVRRLLADAVPEARIEHIGSTAVPGLPAKDVVDILVGVPHGDIRSAAGALAAQGLDLEGDRPDHCWLCGPDRERRDVVVHVVAKDGPIWEERLAFRDLLRSSPAARHEYLHVKREALRISDRWDAYTASKGPHIREILRRHGHIPRSEKDRSRLMTTRPQLCQTVLDARDVRRLAEFYRELVGLVYRPGDEPPTDGSSDELDWLVLRTPEGGRALAFQEAEHLAPSTWPSPEVPMQLHLDLTVPDVASLRAAREHALSLGARQVLDRSEEAEEPLYVLADPEGHPFCLFVG